MVSQNEVSAVLSVKHRFTNGSGGYPGDMSVAPTCALCFSCGVYVSLLFLSSGFTAMSVRAQFVMPGVGTGIGNPHSNPRQRVAAGGFPGDTSVAPTCALCFSCGVYVSLLFLSSGFTAMSVRAQFVMPGVGTGIGNPHSNPRQRVAAGGYPGDTRVAPTCASRLSSQYDGIF